MKNFDSRMTKRSWPAFYPIVLIVMIVAVLSPVLHLPKKDAKPEQKAEIIAVVEKTAALEESPSVQETPVAEEVIVESSPDVAPEVQVIATNRVHIMTHFDVTFDQSNNQQ